MSLAFSFQLTPRQTELLLTCAFGHYRKIDTNIDDLLPIHEMSSFVTIGQKLIQKGLLSHDNSRNPTWAPTERGIALAKMIVEDARKIVAFEETAKPLPIKKKAVK